MADCPFTRRTSFPTVGRKYSSQFSPKRSQSHQQEFDSNMFCIRCFLKRSKCDTHLPRICSTFPVYAFTDAYVENAPVPRGKARARKDRPKCTSESSRFGKDAVKARRALARTGRPGASMWTRPDTAEKDEGEDELIPRYTYTAVSKSSHTRGNFLDEGAAPEPWTGFYIRGADAGYGLGMKRKGWF